VLCRQKAEFHGGSLHLNNREQNLGCAASLQLFLPKTSFPYTIEKRYIGEKAEETELVLILENP